MRARGPERSIGGMGRTFGLHRHMSDGGDYPPVKVTGSRLKRVARYFIPYWRQWIVIMACIAVMSYLAVLPPLYVRGILDDAIPDKNAGLLHLLVGAIVGVTIISGLINVLQSWLAARVGQSIMHDLREGLYRHLQRQSLGFYTAERAGEIVSRVNNDVGAVQTVATSTVVSIETVVKGV